MHFASSQPNIKAAQLLVECGANVHARNNDGETPLHLASKGGYIYNMRLLVDRGADVDAQDNNNLTPLHLASLLSIREAQEWVRSRPWILQPLAPMMAQLLLERGANVHLRDKNGQTPLHCILNQASDEFLDPFFEVIRLLLEHNVDVDAQDNNHSTPLHLASCSGSIKAIQLLLQYGANIQLQDINGDTPFQVALARGRQEVMQLLS